MPVVQDELEATKQVVDELSTIIAEQTRRIRTLEAALRPFARYDVRSGRDQVTVTIETADINEARRVLGMKVSA